MLSSWFIAVEDRNFALFNYVNEQNNEIERLTEQITEVRACNILISYVLKGLSTGKKCFLTNISHKSSALL